MKRQQLDVYDMFILTLIGTWVVMVVCLALNEFTWFWVLLGYNCICTPTLGVLLRNIPTRK